MVYSLAEQIAERQSELYTLHRQYLISALAQAQATIGWDKTYTRGEGAYLWDAEGTRHLDLLSGYGRFGLGRGHPTIKQAMQEVLARPKLVRMDCFLLASLLAEELVKRMPPGLDAVLFANSGADAIDTAIKLARAATGRLRVIHLNHAYHGLMPGTLSLSGGCQFREGFKPLLAGSDGVEMDDLEDLERELSRGDVAALVVEPVQGLGVYIPTNGYLPAVQRLCRKHGTLLICNEIQVGMGRTGRFLCCEHWGLEPDMVTLSRSLGGGYMPLGATITRRSIHSETLGRLDHYQVHSTTFGQDELAMAAGLATLHVLDEERLVERAATVGRKLRKGLAALQERHEIIGDVRGKGLMIGIEFRPPQSFRLRAAWAIAETAQKGLFAQLVVTALLHEHQILAQVGGPGVNIIKLLPPLIIGEEEVEAIVTAFDAVMADVAHVRGRVWSRGMPLIEHATAQKA